MKNSSTNSFSVISLCLLIVIGIRWHSHHVNVRELHEELANASVALEEVKSDQAGDRQKLRKKILAQTSLTLKAKALAKMEVPAKTENHDTGTTRSLGQSSN